MNVAFKHLEDRIRIGELTLAQWAWLLIGFAGACIWGFYLSPFGLVVTTFTAIYVAGLPALAAVFAGFTELDVVGMAVGAWRWWRADNRFLPGAGEGPAQQGYCVQRDPGADGAGYRPQPAIEMEHLWHS